MHSMKKHKGKKPPLANISAEKVTSENAIKNERTQENGQSLFIKGEYTIILYIRIQYSQNVVNFYLIAI